MNLWNDFGALNTFFVALQMTAIAVRSRGFCELRSEVRLGGSASGPRANQLFQGREAKPFVSTFCRPMSSRMFDTVNFDK